MIAPSELIGRYDHGLVLHFTSKPSKIISITLFEFYKVKIRNSSDKDKGVPQPKRSSSVTEMTPSDLRRDSKVCKLLIVSFVTSIRNDSK